MQWHNIRGAIIYDKKECDNDMVACGVTNQTKLCFLNARNKYHIVYVNISVVLYKHKWHQTLDHISFNKDNFVWTG